MHKGGNLSFHILRGVLSEKLQDEVFCVSFCANAFGKGMNLSLPLSAIYIYPHPLARAGCDKRSVFKVEFNRRSVFKVEFNRFSF